MLTPSLSATQEAFLRRALGDFRPLSEPGGTEGDRVVEVAEPEGKRWYLKQVADAEVWRREVDAYRSWTRPLGDLVPRLRDADQGERLLLVSAVPGVRADTVRGPGHGVHRKAGGLLRALHDAVPARPLDVDLSARAQARLEAELRRSEGLLSAEEVAVARQRVAPVTDVEPDALGGLVPCHGDVAPRNLLVAKNGVVRLIDFGCARWHVPAYDLVRLCYGVWWERPRLPEHFFAGYGRWPSAEEWVLLEAYVAVHAVTMARIGRRYAAGWVERRAHDRLRRRLADVLPVIR